MCDDTADEPLHVVRVVDEVWRAVESDGVGHLLGQVQFSIILAFVIVRIVVLNDIVVDSSVVLLEFFNLQFTIFVGAITASSRTTTLLRICARCGSKPT